MENDFLILFFNFLITQQKLRKTLSKFVNKIQNRNWRCRFTPYKHVKSEELFFDTFSHSISDKNVCCKSEKLFHTY